MSTTVTATAKIRLVRTFDAPKDLVWEVWTQAEHVSHWFGPHEYTIPFCEWDAQVGGRIKLHMRSPEGTIIPLTGSFIEVEPTDRMVFLAIADGPEGEPMLESTTTVEFFDRDGKTEVVLSASAVGYGDFAPLALGGMELGWAQSQEKLLGYLRTLA